MNIHKNAIEFSLGEDFSVFPGGRHCEDGEYSAECLKEHLFYLLEEHPSKTIILNLDGTRGVGSSFLHELVAHTQDSVLQKIVFTSTSKSYLQELTLYNKNVRIRHISNEESFWKKVRKIFYV
jgi:anti-anti-sigma regulatory factor